MGELTRDRLIELRQECVDFGDEEMLAVIDMALQSADARTEREGWVSVPKQSLEQMRLIIDAFTRPRFSGTISNVQIIDRPFTPEEFAALTAPHADARKAGMEEAAKICQRRAEKRFEEYGITEWDTGASYYPKAQEWCQTADEEDEDCAKAIRAAAELPAPLSTPAEDKP